MTKVSDEIKEQLSLEQVVEHIRWSDGLVPAIVQDVDTRKVLMMAYMNRESLKLSLESGEAWFWSRSRQELWHKGATSGNVQTITSLKYDCDGDTLLVEVKPNGPACHTGAVTCFHNEIIGLPEKSTDKAPDKAVRHLLLRIRIPKVALRYWLNWNPLLQSVNVNALRVHIQPICLIKV